MKFLLLFVCVSTAAAYPMLALRSPTSSGNATAVQEQQQQQRIMVVIPTTGNITVVPEEQQENVTAVSPTAGAMASGTTLSATQTTAAGNVTAVLEEQQQNVTAVSPTAGVMASDTTLSATQTTAAGNVTAVLEEQQQNVTAVSLTAGSMASNHTLFAPQTTAHGNVTVVPEEQQQQQNVNAVSPTAGAMASNTTLDETAAGMNVSSETEAEEMEAESVEALQDDPFHQQGDILMRINEDRNSVNSLWPDGIVYYKTADSLADRKQEILEAFKMISDATCIRFIPHTSEFNYVVIKEGRGCASFVGCQGGAQPLFYSRKCRVGNLCHEVIHALGVHHEHTRRDRDGFINVKWHNIISGKEKNFEVKEGNTQGFPYDTDSIMHYGPSYFSKNGSPTLMPKEKVTMGQRTHLSELDKAKLNKLYRCD